MRVAQAEERVLLARTRFGDDFAAFVFVEAVGHHAVEAVGIAQLLSTEFGQLLHTGEILQLREGGSQRSQLPFQIATVVRLDFDDDEVVRARAMDSAIEQAVVAQQVQTEQTADTVLTDCIAAEGVAQILERTRIGHFAENGAGREIFDAQHLLRIRRTMRDDPVVVERQKRAERLNATQLMNGFAVAVREVVSMVGFVHAVPATF